MNQFNASSCTARVKWFNPAKGFGFVLPENSDRDVFIHISVVNQAGYESLKEGTTLKCEIGNGNRGQEVKAILSVDESTAVEGGGFGGGGFGGGGGGGKFGSRPQRAPRNNFNDGEERTPVGEINGTVKWFNGQKGFGFISPQDGGKDIFVHFSVLRKSGLQSLDEGQQVRVKVVKSSKGQEADAIELL